MHGHMNVKYARSISTPLPTTPPKRNGEGVDLCGSDQEQSAGSCEQSSENLWLNKIPEISWLVQELSASG